MIPKISKQIVREKYDRVMTAMRGEKPDGVPGLAALGHVMVPAAVFGIPFGELCKPENAKAFCDVSIASDLLLGWDVYHEGIPGAYAAIGQFGLGVPVMWTPHAGPLPRSSADVVCETVDELEKFEIPDYSRKEVYERDISIPLFVACNEYLAKEYGITTAWSHEGGSFNINAAALVGPERFYLWMKKEPDFAHKASDIAIEFAIRRAEYGIARVLEVIGNLPPPPLMGGGGIGNEVVSPEQWKEYFKPGYVRMWNKVKELGVGVLTHFCGDHTLNFRAGLHDDLPNIQTYQFSEFLNIKEIVDRYGKKYAISSNLDPGALIDKPASWVYEEAKSQILIGKELDKPFLLGSGCDISPQTPAGNLLALAKALKDYGLY